jgi:integrase
MSIVTLFQYARAHGYLPKDQRTEAEHVGRAKDRGGKIEILRPKELDQLLKKADAEATLYLALGAFTGLRSAELIRLEWHDINFDRDHIIVGKEKSKTATRRLVPIQPNLMQWLLPYRGLTGRIFSSEHAADRTIAFAKKHVKWPNNALRHSYATYRLATTQDAAKVALEMGNSPTMLFTNYRELADEQDGKAWFAIAPKRAKNVVQFAAQEPMSTVS